MSHTPGPWSIYSLGETEWDLLGPYTKEDWQLAAAAPELLMLVRHIVDHHEPGALDMLFGSGWSDHAKQVLAKVDGV